MSKHTKGPWRVITPEERGEIYGDKDISGFGLTIVDDEGVDYRAPWIIAEVADGQPGEGGPDANLLAAAPDLLEALEGAVEWMSQDGCDCGNDEPRTCALCVAEAAIAKTKKKS